MFFHHKGNRVQGIAFDCGTSGVRASLFVCERTDTAVKPEVFQIIRAPFETGASMDAHLLKRQTGEGIRRIIREIPRNFQPSTITIGLSSPFYISKTTRVTRRREQANKPIAKDELQNVITHAEHAFKQDAQKQLANTEVAVFGSRVLKTYINGYRVPQAIGMDGNTIDLHICFEATTDALRRDFMEFLRDRFASVSVRLSSIPMALFYAASMLYEAENGFLIVDIGGEVSDLSLTVEGVLEHIVALPLGTNLLVREVAAFLRISFSDAAFIMRRYAERTLDDSQQQRLTPLIERFKKIWLAQFLKIFGVYVRHYHIPSQILLTGGGILPFHQELFSDPALGAYTLQQNLAISVASPALLGNHFLKNQFSGPSDFGLASLTLLNARGIL